jgi:hypothetical protein
MDSLARLLQLVEAENKTVNEVLARNNSPFLFCDLLRALDYYSFGNYSEKEEGDYFIKYGYPKILRQLYLTNAFFENSLPYIPTTIESLSFCYFYLTYLGKLRVVERMCEMTKAKLVDLRYLGSDEFEIKVLSKSSCEFWENKSVEDYFGVVKNIVLKDKINSLRSQEEQILKILAANVEPWHRHYIKYSSTAEIDNYYYSKGYVHLLSTQLFDDFDEDYTFGTIKYKYFLDVVQSIMGTALKHMDCCHILTLKDKNVKIYNILPIPQIHEEVLIQYATFLEIDIEIIREIMDVLTISAGNISDRSQDDKSFSPPFVKVGKRFVIKSMYGCLHAPIQYLQNELKRRYERDYMAGLNKREDVFRRQLYSLFKSDRFVKINRNIIIKSNVHTDIDAIIFDKETKSLGLFQLKWQDKFSSNLKARRSRISNFYPKANEWVGKIYLWLANHDIKMILSSFGIDDSEVSNIYVFVLGRYSTNFTNENTDERAAWGSWYHVLELLHKIRTDFNDPVRELYFKLKIDTPSIKKIPDEYLNDYKIKFEKFTVSWKYG